VQVVVEEDEEEEEEEGRYTHWLIFSLVNSAVTSAMKRRLASLKAG